MPNFDILIRNGWIVDGTGAPMRRGSIGVRGERIAAVGDIHHADAETVIDAEGLVVCPGFIDAHSHADKTLPLFPRAENYVMQGVTTTVGGNCGNTIAPILDWWPPNMFWDSDIIFELRPYQYYSEELLPADEVKAKIQEIYGVELAWGSFHEFLDWMKDVGISVNHAPMVGHNTIRAQVMGQDWKREPSQGELEEMKGLVREAMEAGAFGLSTGLDYPPGAYADTQEIIELVKVVKEFGGIYATHWRRTGPRRAGATPPINKIRGIREAIEIGRKTGVQVQLSHLSAGYTIYPQPPPRVLEEAAVKATLKVIDEALADGVSIFFDIIPNVTGGTLTSPYLASLLTPWLRVAGSREALAKALRMGDFREEVKSAIQAGKWYWLNPAVNPFWSRLVRVIDCGVKEFVGKTLSQIAEEMGKDDLEALFEVLVRDPEAKMQSLGDKTDFEKAAFLRHSNCMVGLDTYTFDGRWAMKHPPYYLPHPNTYGGMPRYLRRYVREMKVLTLEEAIHKITQLPAETFHIRDRGVLRPGAYADIVIFDPSRVREASTPLEPRRPPIGIHHVIVNGVVTVRDGSHTGARPGRILRLHGKA